MDTYEGRLECDGHGNLLAHEKVWVGSKTVTVFDADGEPVLNGEGNPVTTEIQQYKLGKHHGRPVAHDPQVGKYVFLGDGDPSHNEQHHEQFVLMDGTVDKTMTDDESLVNADETSNPHHFGVTEDDPHYDASAPNNTRLKSSPDKIAAKETGHTAAYKEV